MPQKSMPQEIMKVRGSVRYHPLYAVWVKIADVRVGRNVYASSSRRSHRIEISTVNTEW